MKRLVLIDGNAILHRAYHALPPLTAPDGSLVNAVYGFTSMLLKIVSDLQPTHLAVTFDRPAPTFRKEMFADYQAKRPKMDEELVGQIDTVHKVIDAFGVPIFEVDGFEADDVIGTIVEKTKGKRQNAIENVMNQTIIVTGDKDLLQLVDKNTYVYMPTKGLSEAKLYGEEDVKEKLGVAPKNIPDYKALAGDASDNYPGVPGIGPKTAIDLVTSFGSTEALYRAIRKKDKKTRHIPSGVLQKLRDGQESAKLSKRLATIRGDAPIDVRFARPFILDTPKARNILEELNFRSLIKRLKEKEADGKKKTRKGKKEPEKKPQGEQQQLF